MAIASTSAVRVLGRAPLSDLFPGLSAEPELRLGLTFGAWSVIDVIGAALDANPAGLETVSVMSWRMSRVDVSELLDEIASGRVESVRLLSSSEFRGIEPLEFTAVTELAGHSFRVCRSHLKGLILTGFRGPDPLPDMVYLTSANFNRNGQSESYELHSGGPVPAAYASLVTRAFELQPARAWKAPGTSAGNTLFRKLLTDLRLATPVTVGESRTDKARRLAGGVDAADPEDEPDQILSLPDMVAAMRRVAHRNSPFGSGIRTASVGTFEDILSERRDTPPLGIRPPD